MAQVSSILSLLLPFATSPPRWSLGGSHSSPQTSTFSFSLIEFTQNHLIPLFSPHLKVLATLKFPNYRCTFEVPKLFGVIAVHTGQGTALLLGEHLPRGSRENIPRLYAIAVASLAWTLLDTKNLHTLGNNAKKPRLWLNWAQGTRPPYRFASSFRQRDDCCRNHRPR